MAFYDGFPKYVPVAEKKKLAEKSTEKLRKKNPGIMPVIITGRALARTWWGKAWNDNLESYADYSNRIGRGRSYVRNGAVLDLQITQGQINALVQGSGARPYKIHISIQPLSSAVWEVITKNCAGKMDSLQELMEGKFPKGLSDLFTAKGRGLFPAPKDISFQCTCPDSAHMCKHVAAALYGVGARLDDHTSLFFSLRKVNVEELISETVMKRSQSLLDKSKVKGRRVIADTDLSGMFGIELETEATKEQEPVGKKKLQKK